MLDERGAIASSAGAGWCAISCADRRCRAALVVVRRDRPAASGRACSSLLNRLSYSASGSPVGRSVRPVPPISSVSPVNTRSVDDAGTSNPRVWPGVCSTCRRSSPTMSISPSSTPQVDERARGSRGASRPARRAAAPSSCARGEVIGVGVGVDDVADAQAVAARPAPGSDRSGAAPDRSRTPAQVSAQPIRYDWQPPVATCSKITT